MSGQKFYYPDETLARLVISRWQAIGPLKPMQERDLPTSADLAVVLNVCYQASLGEEEGRKTTFRVCLHEPEVLKNHVASVSGAQMFFDTPRPFSPQELRKLSPAIPPAGNVLLIAKQTSHWEIVGLMQTGFAFAEQIRSGSPFNWVRTPPDSLTISCFEPGNLNISRRGIVFLQLHDAMIVDPTESPLDRGILNEKFNGVLTELAADASSMGSQIRPDDLKPAADGFYFSFLNRLLFAIHEQHHGGTLLFLQPANVDKDLRTKYQTKHIEIWNILLRSLVDFKHITQLRAEAKDQGLAKEKYSSFTTLFSNVLSIDRNLQEQSLLLAALANVDGALLLDFQFRILGFGAEILAREEFQFDVHMSLDPDAKSTTSQPIDMYGTRHRSTFRFLRENPGSVAFIISQDGSVKGACSDGEKRVIYWTNLEMFFKLF